MIIETVVTVLAISVGYGAYAAIDLRRWTQRAATGIADADRRLTSQRHAIEALQRLNVGLEQQLVETQAAIAYLCWRLAERGVLNEDDAPVDGVATIN